MSGRIVGSTGIEEPDQRLDRIALTPERPHHGALAGPVLQQMVNTRCHARPSLRTPGSNMPTKAVDRSVGFDIRIRPGPVGVIAAGGRNRQLRRAGAAAQCSGLRSPTMLVQRPVGRRLHVRAVKNPLALCGGCTVVSRHLPSSSCATARDSTPRWKRRALWRASRSLPWRVTAGGMSERSVPRSRARNRARVRVRAGGEN